MFQQRHGVGATEALAREGRERVVVAGVHAARARPADAEALLELGEVDARARTLFVQLVEYRASDLERSKSRICYRWTVVWQWDWNFGNFQQYI